MLDFPLAATAASDAIQAARNLITLAAPGEDTSEHHLPLVRAEIKLLENALQRWKLCEAGASVFVDQFPPLELNELMGQCSPVSSDRPWISAESFHVLAVAIGPQVNNNMFREAAADYFLRTSKEYCADVYGHLDPRAVTENWDRAAWYLREKSPGFDCGLILTMIPIESKRAAERAGASAGRSGDGGAVAAKPKPTKKSGAPAKWDHFYRVAVSYQKKHADADDAAATKAYRDAFKLQIAAGTFPSPKKDTLRGLRYEREHRHR